MNREKTRVPRVRGKLAEVTAGLGGGSALSELNNGRECAFYAHVPPAQSPWVPWGQVLGAIGFVESWYTKRRCALRHSPTNWKILSTSRRLGIVVWGRNS